MSDNANDVNSAEEAATVSSTGEQTTQDTAAEKSVDEKAVDNSQTEAKEVPELNRMAEKARKAEKEAAQYKARLAELEKKAQEPALDDQSRAVKEQLTKMGFITREEQAAELKRQSEDNRVQQELSRLETTFDGKDGKPKFDRNEILDFALERQIGDLETAYKAKHWDTLVDWHIKQASSKTKGIKTEASDGSGSSEAGTTDTDLKAAIARGDRNALRTFVKRFAPKS